MKSILRKVASLPKRHTGLSIKQFARDWLPPRIFDLLRNSATPFSFSTTFEDLSDSGWNVEGVVEARRKMWGELCESLSGTSVIGLKPEQLARLEYNDLTLLNIYTSYAYVFALACHQKSRVSVLDWGGATGEYRILSEAAVSDVEIDFHVVDVPVICKLGRELQPDVNFHDKREEWIDNKYDLVFSSSSIQYMSDWKAIASDLAECAANYLFITRTPIVEYSASFATVQAMPEYGMKAFAWSISKSELVDLVKDHGMELIREFVCQPGPHVRNAPEQNTYMGFLFRRA
ncbi:MAG: methyltransferase, TIGR04325 family [Armatimonadota bacterium]